MLEGDVVEAGLEVYHADPLSAPQLGAVAPCVVQLIVVLVSFLVDGHNILAHPVGLARLNPRHQQQRSNAPWLLVRQYWPDDPFRYELVQVHVQPCFLFRPQTHWARLDPKLVA